jgi:glycerol-3-phosphate O-acyltransferase
MRLRDLLKFEFFFAEKETFLGELLQELRFHDPDWETRVKAGSDEIHALIRSFRPLTSHRVLRPFVQAYQIVGDLLEQEDPSQAFDEARFVERCLRLGRQHHLQRRLHSAQSISQVLFRNALSLAENRGLLEPGALELEPGRRTFAEEIRSVVRRVEAIDALAASRRAGLK